MCCVKDEAEVRPPIESHSCDIEVGRTEWGKRLFCRALATMQINRLHLCERHAKVAMEHICGRPTKIERTRTTH